jgi:hypothetical protein
VADPELIREYTVRSVTSVDQAAQQINALSRAGWHLHSLIPDGRLYLLVMFRMAPRPIKPLRSGPR